MPSQKWTSYDKAAPIGGIINNIGGDRAADTFHAFILKEVLPHSVLSCS